MPRCYNKGCGLDYSEESNGDESCSFHPGGPVFHDAYKGWSCCKRRTTDFTEFLNIPGCTKGRHTNEKPVEPEPAKKPENTPEKQMIVTQTVVNRKPLPKKAPERPSDDLPFIPLKKVVSNSLKAQLAKIQTQLKEDKQEEDTDIVQPGTVCKHSGCEVSYVDETSDSDSCLYHSGSPIFHEGYKFWTCCQKRTSDFSEFLKQAGCTKGKHQWTLSKEERAKLVACRYDWYLMGSDVIVNIYAKLANPEDTFVEANKTMLKAHVSFGEDSAFDMNLKLFGVIDPEKSSVVLSPPKVEIKLKRADPAPWSKLELKQPPPPVTEES